MNCNSWPDTTKMSESIICHLNIITALFQIKWFKYNKDVQRTPPTVKDLSHMKVQFSLFTICIQSRCPAVLCECSFPVFSFTSSLKYKYLSSTNQLFFGVSKSLHLISTLSFTSFQIIYFFTLFVMHMKVQQQSSFSPVELFIEQKWSKKSYHTFVMVDCCCIHASDSNAEDGGPNQAGSSLQAVELPRKRKGELEERSERSDIYYMIQ